MFQSTSLFLKFICYFGKYLRTSVGNIIADVCRLYPLYSILDYSLNIRVIVGRTALMSRLKIEHLSNSAMEAATASEDISVLIPAAEDKCIWLGNVEWLTVELLLFDNEMIRNSFRNWVLRHKIPDDLLLIASP